MTSDQKYYLFHREERLAWQAEYRERNSEKVRASKRAYYQRNRKSAIQKSVAYNKHRLGCDPQFRVVHCLRSRISKLLRGASKSAGTLELLGMSREELRVYLQGQFRPGMTWENYGKVWHIDHLRPCASFDLTQPAQQRKCFHWSNLQPLFAGENLSKGAKI